MIFASKKERKGVVLPDASTRHEQIPWCWNISALVEQIATRLHFQCHWEIVSMTDPPPGIEPGTSVLICWNTTTELRRIGIFLYFILFSSWQVAVAISIKSHDLCCKWTQRARVQDPDESSGYLFNKSAYIPTPWNLLVPGACIREDNFFPFFPFFSHLSTKFWNKISK